MIAAFLGLDRLEDGGVAAIDLLNADPALKSHVNQALGWLVDEGATKSEALVALLVGLETEGPEVLVVDMIEQDLGQSTQEALITHLRHRVKTGGRPLFLLTRSSAILDLAAVGPDEAIILCPANHSPPARVAPYPVRQVTRQLPRAWHHPRYGRGSHVALKQRNPDLLTSEERRSGVGSVAVR